MAMTSKKRLPHREKPVVCCASKARFPRIKKSGLWPSRGFDQRGVNRKLKMQVFGEFVPLLRVSAIFQIDHRHAPGVIFHQQIDEAVNLPADERCVGWR